MLRQEWKDYKLDWNETEYGGVKSIRLPSKMIWTPDILMYNRYVGAGLVLGKGGGWFRKS